jgi:hypothetical protein
MAREQLQTLLESLCPRVYFQPPSNITMQYPCIVYKRSTEDVRYADNQRFDEYVQYEVMVIDRDPDSTIPGSVGRLPLCRYERFFAVDDLNHDVYNLYWKGSV